MTSPEVRAQIRRYFYAEHWKIGTIARELGVHPDAVRKFVRTTYEAAAYTNAHHAETAAMMADITKIPLATIQKMTRVDGATSSDPGLIQPAIETAARYKILPRAFPAKEAYITG